MAKRKPSGPQKPKSNGKTRARMSPQQLLDIDEEAEIEYTEGSIRGRVFDAVRKLSLPLTRREIVAQIAAQKALKINEEQTTTVIKYLVDAGVLVENTNLLEVFVSHVENGLIVGKDESSGPAALKRMTKAVRGIMAGRDPDRALGIVRRKGRKRDTSTAERDKRMAAFIHKRLQAGEKWEVIVPEVNAILTKSGRRPVSRPRMTTIYHKHEPGIRLGMRFPITNFFDRD